MPKRLLDVITGHCSHEFSWPRRWSDGFYYQVCLVCGDEYLYDWKNMRRKERITAGHFAERVLRQAQKGARTEPRRKPSWSPRARRLKLENRELQWRERGGLEWYTGVVENISASGVLFRSQQPVKENASLELILEMPAEISGQEHASVLATCTVVRVAEPEVENGLPAYGAVLWEYRFLRPQRRV